MSFTQWIDVGVSLGELVAVIAMRLEAVNHVRSVRMIVSSSRNKMVRIHATSLACAVM